jgi:hypothetical protein
MSERFWQALQVAVLVVLTLAVVYYGSAIVALLKQAR